MDQHELISLVKQMALDLGRTPTKAEFDGQLAGAAYKVGKLFRNYSLLLQAAGLDTYDDRRSGPKKKSKLDSSIFERDIAETLDAHKERASTQPQHYTPTLIIPDTHFPFASQRVLDAIYEWANRYKPTRVIQVGDLYDLYAHSKFAKSLNIYTPKDEERLGRMQAEKMWETVRGIVPDAECVQLIGNHDLRPLRSTLASLPALEHAIEEYLHKLMTFPGVTLVPDPRQEYEFEGIHVIHGHRSGYGAHMAQTLVNTIHGHDHKLGVAFRRVRGQTLWELHSGFAGDVESKVFHYTPQKSTQEQPGFGWLDERAPMAVPV